VDPVHHRGRQWSAAASRLHIIAVHGDRGVGGGAIICAVSRYPGDWDVNLIQQWRNLRWIVIVLIYHTVFSIDRQMALSGRNERKKAPRHGTNGQAGHHQPDASRVS
jgi:hypothetical protein